MKPLAQQYTKNGYNHKVIWRDNDYAITELTDETTGKIACYEAFEIIKCKARTTKLMTTEAREITPSNEQWGYKGLTATSYEAAQDKIQKLKNRKNEKQN